jgi:hypothetical protein
VAVNAVLWSTALKVVAVNAVLWSTALKFVAVNVVLWSTALKAGGRGFDSQRSYWNYLLSLSLRPHCGPGVDKTSTRKYQGYFVRSIGGRCVGQTNLLPSRDDCLELCQPHSPGTLRVCPDLDTECFTFKMLYYRLQNKNVAFLWK